MAESKVQDNDKFLLRLPDGLRDRISDMAAENGRSMNAQILFMIGAQMNGIPVADTQVEPREPRPSNSELAALRRRLEIAEAAAREADTLIASRGGAVRFYELSIRTLARSVLASGAVIEGPLLALLDEWASYEGMLPPEDARKRPRARKARKGSGAR